jgi:hypothetical protein
MPISPARLDKSRLFTYATSAALTAALVAASPQAAIADNGIEVPSVPPGLEVPAGHKAFMVAHAVGTQNYVCLPTATGFGWAAWGPQATLFDDDDDQKLTHFLSSDTLGTARPTWMHSKDSSTIWASAVASATSVTAPDFVEAGAIPWLLLQVVDSAAGPTGGDKLQKTRYIHRLDTEAGVAPAAGCAIATDVGKKALVPYVTDYYFYKALGDQEAD